MWSERDPGGSRGKGEIAAVEKYSMDGLLERRRFRD